MVTEIFNLDIPIINIRIQTKTSRLWVNHTNSFLNRDFNKIMLSNILLWLHNMCKHKINFLKQWTIKFPILKEKETQWFGTHRLRKKEANRKKFKKREVWWTKPEIKTKIKIWVKETTIEIGWLRVKKKKGN